MSHSPFDGVLLDDRRPPIAGALALLLHLRVARRLAAERGWGEPSLDFVKGRSQACRELLAQGLLPATLRGLRAHGLGLGEGGAPHSLANVVAHLEAYLVEVDREGWIEPDEALWRAVDRVLEGKPGLWIERTLEDGPLGAGLQDLQAARLRALALVPGLGGAVFSLATRKGDATSGLFGSPQPLVEWFLDGLEEHGQGFPNEVNLVEPEGWGSAPWTGALEGLFEGGLELEGYGEVFQRGLVEGSVDLLRQGVEQICRWLDEGFAPREITVIHPEPQKVAAFLEPLLAEEGVPLHVRGGLVPLIESAAWSPLWMLLMGVHRLDPCAVAAGLRASRRPELRQWADILALGDQNGAAFFTDSFMHLKDWAKEGAGDLWRELLGWRGDQATAEVWVDRVEALAGSTRLPVDSDDFFAPLGLLKEAWTREVWTFPRMLSALRAFLEAARSAEVPRYPDGLRLVAPGTLLDDWNGARATLILDLSEGAWPGTPAANPDLDWNRKAALNQALVAATRAGGEVAFPPALQRFWLPRSEHGDQIPRAFQREAYAFNKVLAMTSERLVVLSPAQDDAGRRKGQGPFWTALEGAGAWMPPAEGVRSRLRWRWEGHGPDAAAEARARAAQARTPEAALLAQAPGGDRVAEIRSLWLRGAAAASPTALEGLARCPFRSLAERVWGLGVANPASNLSMAVGTLAHHLLEASLEPFLNLRDWPGAFRESLGEGDMQEALEERLAGLWEANRDTWLAGLKEIPLEAWPQAARGLEELLPGLASALRLDAQATGPTKAEVAFLWPQLLAFDSRARNLPLQGGWTRTLLALEGPVGPVELTLPGGRSLAVAGTVDRLEHWEHEEGPTFMRVTDYKTSSRASVEAYAGEGAPFGAHLQTPLYMLLVGAVFHEETTAALVPLRAEEPAAFTGHLRTLVEEGGEGGWEARLLEHLGRFDARLEEGDFPPTPGGHCRWCELGALCGRPVDLETEEETD